MEYLVVIHRDREDGPCGVTVPDLPGCWTGGDTLAEALANAREGIAVHVEALLEAGLEVPEPSAAVDPEGGIVAVVPLDDGLLSDRAVRVNVTLPSRLLTLMDRFAGPRGRSGLLATAVLAYMVRSKEPGSFRMHYRPDPIQPTACRILHLGPGQESTADLREVTCEACRTYILEAVPQPRPGGLTWEAYLRLEHGSPPPPGAAEATRRSTD